VAKNNSKRSSAYPWYTPRMWAGMTAGGWFDLMSQNRFRITPSRWAMAVSCGVFGIMNSSARLLSEARYRRAAEDVELKAPLFVIGHWRSGTTLLHELLVLDEQFGYPNTIQCTIPHNFAMFEGIVSTVFGRMVPNTREMDSMAFGPDRPQEDEIALCNLGAPSPYRCWAYPHRHFVPPEHLDLKGLPPRELQRWKNALLFLLKRLALKDPRRIVLKSPTHTARIRTLLEMFPDAQFVHITRDPFVVFLSTMRTWTSLSELLRFTRLDQRVIEEQVLANFERMYRALLRDREFLSPRQFHQVRYEDLIANPTGTVASIYEQLELGDFEVVRGKIDAFFEASKDYQRRDYHIEPELRQKISDRWGELILALGYDCEPAGVAHASTLYVEAARRAVAGSRGVRE
jgi:hypothetical protein